MKRAGIYAGWVGFANLGDEAMYEVCRNRFPSVRWSTSYQLAYKPSAPQLLQRTLKNAPQVWEGVLDELHHQSRLRKVAAQGRHGLARLLGDEVGLFGGGTLINREPWNLETYRDLRKRTGSLVPVFGTGVASPEFWSSSPAWKDTRKQWVEALAELPVVGVRGPFSQKFLQEEGARNVVVSGDPAIAFYERYRNRPPRERVDSRLRVAINTGDCSGNLWGDPASIHESLVALARWLQEENHHVELLPVWQKDLEPSVEVARQAGLPQSCVSPPLTANRSFLRKIGTFDILIALKLHAAVLASVANVPCVILEYQPKCLDFAASIAWERFTMRTNDLTPAKLIDRVLLLVNQLSNARKELFCNVGRLAQRFAQYCDQIEPLIVGTKLPPVLPEEEAESSKAAASSDRL